MATILIVDDRPPNRELLVSVLGYHGHRLLEAGDGAEALAAIYARKPDLVISDILMPTMDGYELVRRVRADPAIASTRVVFYTAHYQKHEAARLARACGVAQILSKPAEPELILRVVAEVLAETTANVMPPAPEFDEDHRRLVMDKLAGTIDELTVSNERLATLVDIGLQLASERDAIRLLDKICRLSRELIGARHSLLAVANDDGNETAHFTTAGIDASDVARVQKPTLCAGAPGRAYRNRTTCRLAAPNNDLRTEGLPDGYPAARDMLVAPIVSTAHSYGWVVLTDKVGTSGFTEEDARLLGILTAQAGRVYENSRLYDALHSSEERYRLLSRQLFETQENERRSITRELHDRVGPNLAALNITIEMACRLVPPECGTPVIEKLHDAQQVLMETARHTRDIMAELDPGLLDEYGLAAALEEHGANVGRRFAQKIEIVTEPAYPAVPAIVNAAFFRIAQEAVTNAAKHARATGIRVALSGSPDCAVLVVADDGVGFDPQLPKRGHRGLCTMQERALAIGASLTIDSAPGSGTRVEISWQVQS